MKNVENNMHDFIQSMKKHYENYLMPETNEKWEEEKWGNANLGWLVARGRSTPLRFDVVPRSKYVPESVNISTDYQEFMKAILVHYKILHNHSYEALKNTLISLKRMYISLTFCRCSTNPCDISIMVINTVKKALEDSQYKQPRKIFDCLIYVHNFCVRHELINSASYYVKNLHGKLCESPSLQNDHLHNGCIDDKIRSGSNKLISYEAFKHLAFITNNTRHDLEKLGCKVADILFATGMRISEVLYLPRDCLVVEHLSSSFVNNSDLCYDFVVRYGIKYYPEKGLSSRVKWLEGNAAKVVDKAYREALEVTKQYHEHAQFLVDSNGSKVLPDSIDEYLDSKTIRDYIFVPMKYYGERDSKKIGCKKVKHSRKKSVDDFLRNFGINPKLVKKSEVGKVVRMHLPTTDPTKVEISVAGVKKQKRLDHFLFIAPCGALSTKQGMLIRHAVNLLPVMQFSKFIGGGNQSCQSIFSIREMTESDGSKIKIDTHSFRHNINTFMALSNISDHLQAIAMGRVDIAQNKAYQHLSIDEEHADERDLIDYRKFKEKSLDSRNLPASLSPLSVNTFHKSKDPLELLKQGKCLNWDMDISEQRNIESSFHSFDNNRHSQDYLADMLDSNRIVGELQDAYQSIKSIDGESVADNFVERNAGNLHILPNGACSNHISLHKCNKAMKCLSGYGCSHLVLTGRPGELEGLMDLHKKSKMNLLTLIKKFGDNPNYHQAIETQEKDIESLEKIIEKSKKSISAKTPVRVFPDGGDFYTGSEERVTLVDLFAKSQSNAKKDEYS